MIVLLKDFTGGRLDVSYEIEFDQAMLLVHENAFVLWDRQYGHLSLPEIDHVSISGRSSQFEYLPRAFGEVVFKAQYYLTRDEKPFVRMYDSYMNGPPRWYCVRTIPFVLQAESLPNLLPTA